MWALLSHGALAQWIRLMLAHEGGVAVRPSLTGGDGLGLCQGPCRPEGPGDEGKRETEGRSGPGGSPVSGSATCWQGIILFGVLLRSHRWSRREIASVHVPDNDVRCPETFNWGHVRESDSWSDGTGGCCHRWNNTWTWYYSWCDMNAIKICAWLLFFFFLILNHVPSRQEKMQVSMSTK